MPDETDPKNFLRTLIEGNEPNIDIVAVHGLNPKSKEYHAERTWTSGDKLWLRDFLPNQLPRARILLFGYNSNVGFQSSTAGVREQAYNLLSRLWLKRQGHEDRPILFIAHSLGGIVIKEALVQAKLRESYDSIYTATFGMAFFGTPHRGSPWTGIGDKVAKAVRTISRNPSNTFLNALKKDGLYASELSANFGQLLENYRYLNFYETLPYKSIGLVVDKRSATFGLPDSRETAIALNADHNDICRFASEDDEEYQLVSALIVDLANSATETAMDRSFFKGFGPSESSLVHEKPEPSYYMIPYLRNPGFVDRKPVIQQLKDRIASIGQSHARLALFGLGGVGKSQIAIEFAYQIRSERPQTAVFWIHASSFDRFREGYHNIIKECNIPAASDDKLDKRTLVKNWLEKECGEWLMIIDNADEASLFTSGQTPQSKAGTADQLILDFLPECAHGSILITTRDRAAGVKFTRGSVSDLIDVRPMTESESSNLIKSVMTDNIPLDSEVCELTDLLDHLPLALVQAAAFIQENMMTVSEYLSLYKENHETQMDLLCESFETLGRDSEVPNAVATTLIVSINKIKERHPQAIEILSLMAFLDKDGVPKSLIQQRISRPLIFTKALGTLKAFSLIQGNEERQSYSLHRLVQLVMRKWLIIRSEFEQKAIQALEIVDKAFPNATFENWKICTSFLPHAQSVLQFVPEYRGKVFRTRLHLQEGIAYYLWSQGHYDDAEQLDLLILEENKKEFGLRHPETLESMGALASTYEDQGRLSEAEELDKHIVQMRKEELGIRHKLTLLGMGNLAALYEKQGRLDEAMNLMLQVLEIERETYGPDHDETIASMACLGSIYLELKQLHQAEELTLEAWNWRKANLGHDHKDTLTSGHMLAMIYDEQGEMKKAESLYSQVLALREERLGQSHPETLCTKGNLAGIYERQGKLIEAQELMLDALECEEKSLGPTHPSTLSSKSTLARLYWDVGLLDMAEKLQVEVLQARKQKLGADHPETLLAMSNLACTWKSQGRDAEAIPLMEHVVHGQKEKLGIFHSDTQNSLETLEEWCRET